MATKGRPLCLLCKQRPRAIAYHRANDTTQYRRLCEQCRAKGKKLPVPVPRWQTSGYKKKLVCDSCGFKAKYASQTVVCHVDGNLHNSELRNLKSICLNCVEVIKKSDLPWRPGDLSPDF
jgi:hypothetical protein